MKILKSLAALALLAACNAAPQTAPQTGAELFQANCAGCHGADARGGAMLEAPDLTTLAARRGGVFPAEFIMSQIDGFTRDATHGAMPEFGGLLSGDLEVWTDPDGVPTPTPAALVRLAEYLEGVQEAG